MVKAGEGCCISAFLSTGNISDRDLRSHVGMPIFSDCQVRAAMTLRTLFYPCDFTCAKVFDGHRDSSGNKFLLFDNKDLS